MEKTKTPQFKKKKNANQNIASTDNLSTQAASQPQLRTWKGLEMVKQLQAKPHLLREIVSYLQKKKKKFLMQLKGKREMESRLQVQLKMLLPFLTKGAQPCPCSENSTVLTGGWEVPNITVKAA